MASTTAGIGVLGGILGVSSSIAKNIKPYREGSVDAQEVIYDAGKEGVGTGVATVLGVMAVGAVGGGFALSLGTAVVAASASKFVWDRSIAQLEHGLSKSDGDDGEDNEIVEEEAVATVDQNDPGNYRRGYEL